MMYVDDSDVYAVECFVLYTHEYVVFPGEYFKDLCQIISPHINIYIFRLSGLY